MAMTKKDFIRLADYLKPEELAKYCEVRSVSIEDGQRNIRVIEMVEIESLLEHLANFCHEQNPAFLRGRWIGYIKGENGPSGGQR